MVRSSSRKIAKLTSNLVENSCSQFEILSSLGLITLDWNSVSVVFFFLMSDCPSLVLDHISSLSLSALGRGLLDGC